MQWLGTGQYPGPRTDYRTSGQKMVLTVSHPNTKRHINPTFCKHLNAYDSEFLSLPSLLRQCKVPVLPENGNNPPNQRQKRLLLSGTRAYFVYYPFIIVNLRIRTAPRTIDFQLRDNARAYATVLRKGTRRFCQNLWPHGRDRCRSLTLTCQTHCTG